MPPFKSGLLKRKSDLNTDNSESSKAALDDESDSSTEGGDLLKGELNLEGDDTDSEGDKSDIDSDQEQDEVLFSDEDSTLGDDEENSAGDSDSSELTDSEDNDDKKEGSDSEESEPNSDSEGKSEDESEANSASEKEDSKAKRDSDTESGIGHTHSSSSESDKKQANTRTTRKKQHKKTQEMDSLDRLTDTISKANITTQPVANKEEYESGDTSDEEDRRNTVGDVPMWWYSEYPHLGYDLDGRRILKPPQRDQIDDFLKKCEDPDFWRTVKDPATGQDVVLSKEDLELLSRLREGRAPAAQPEEPWVDWFTRDVLATPLRAFPDHKRSFLPSRHERRAVGRLVHALRMGWLKTRRQLAAERHERRQRRFYDLWGAARPSDDAAPRAAPRHIPAPRRALPSHAESYRPPPEYLLDAQEMKEWNGLSETPWKRKYTFLPTQYSSLRAVPAYERFTRERFLRCLDLYLAPRAIKMKLTIGPDELVPRLPSPRSLRPFPTSEALVFRGHTGVVRCCGFDPSGQYAVSASDDGSVRVWETATGRCLRSVALGAEAASCVAWAPVAGLPLVAAACGARLVLLAPGGGVGGARVAARADALLEEAPPAHDAAVDARTAAAAAWERVSAEEWARGVRLAVTHFRPVKHLAWHARGDYLAVTLHDAAARSVLVHQVSRRRTQLPFARAKGLVQCAVFHPTRPQLFVATQRAVRVYDLVRQELVRKLRPGAQWLSSVALHPGGEDLVVGSYDRKVAWFDLQLSAAPYRTLRLLRGAVRGVAFSARYPLFAAVGDDGAVVCHGAVFADLLQSPLLVPLRRLAVPRRGELAALHAAFHPAQPWLLLAAADHTLRLYT